MTEPSDETRSDRALPGLEEHETERAGEVTPPDRYQILRPLGQEGMPVVYTARGRKLGFCKPSAAKSPNRQGIYSDWNPPPVELNCKGSFVGGIYDRVTSF